MNRRQVLRGTGASGLAVLAFRGANLRAQEATPVAESATPVAGGARVFELPGDEVFPEGVAYDPESGLFYVGSTTDGTLYEGNLETGEVSVFAADDAERTTAVGMKVDANGRLIVVGGPTGRIFVLDTASGETLAIFSNGLGADETFINDVAVAPNGDVYATDSFNPALYRIAADAIEDGGDLEVFVEFEGTTFEYGDPGSFNANGIAIDDQGAYAIVVQSGTGKLFRIGLEDGAVAEIAIDGESVTFGDGLALDGQTLYVVRNQLGLIVRLELAADFGSADVIDSFTDLTLAYPTTIAQVDDQLLVVNSQFDRRPSGDPVLPFTVSLIDIPPVASTATPVASPAAVPDEAATPIG